MKEFTCPKCKETYNEKYSSCPVCEDKPENLTLPRSYRVPVITLLNWILLTLGFSFFISLYINIILKSGASLFYLLVLSLCTGVLFMVINLIRTNAALIKATDEGLIRVEYLPPRKITLLWNDIKQFKFASGKSNRGVTKYYTIKSKDKEIGFNSFFINSHELIELVKTKAGVRLKKKK